MLVKPKRSGEDTFLHSDPRSSAGGQDAIADEPSAVANAIGHIDDRADAPQPATGIVSSVVDDEFGSDGAALYARRMTHYPSLMTHDGVLSQPDA